MNIKKPNRTILVVGILALLQAQGQEVEESTPAALEELVLQIESVSSAGSPPSDETVEWLMSIVSSEGLHFHKPFVTRQGSDGTSYYPPSTYAIWELSRIVSDPPMTYTDPEWEVGAYMTGERKRWVEWWKEKKGSVVLRDSDANEKLSVEAEKKAQEANLKLHLKISKEDARRQVDQEYSDYFEIEQAYLFPGGSSDGEGLGLGIASNQSDESGRSEEVQSEVPQSREGEEQPEESPSLPKWALAVIVVAVLGILFLLVRAFLRGRE